MTRLRSAATLSFALVVLAGCPTSGPAASDSAATTTSDGSSGTDETTTDAGESGSDEADTGDFVPDEDMPGDTSCDPFGTGCPEGQKCAPYGDQDWTDFRCVELDPDPKPAGSACTIFAGTWSGMDDCDVGSACLIGGIDTGVCEPLCNVLSGCGDAADCIPIIDGMAGICLGQCDVVAQDCSELETCSDYGHCYPGSGYGADYAEPCPDGSCGPGLHCRPADEIPSCNAEWCCTKLCWANDPNGADVCPDQDSGQVCEPLDPNGLGYCALP